MNQKLRTSSSIAILLAILCIVCLSLGMFFAVFNVTFAADGDQTTTEPTESTEPSDDTDNSQFISDESNPLWLVSCDGGSAIPLIDGGSFDYYYSSSATGKTVIGRGEGDLSNRFVFFNGDETSIYTVTLNPDYILDDDGHTLGLVYNLDNLDFGGSNQGVGAKDISLDVRTGITIAEIDDANNTVTLTKTWTIATLVNGITGNGITDTFHYEFAGNYSSASMASPKHGDIVLYNISGPTMSVNFAAKYTGANVGYYSNAIADQYGALSVEGNAIDISNLPLNSTYLREQLKTLRAGDYVLTITTSSAVDKGIYYASSVNTLIFTVDPVSLINGTDLRNGFEFVLSEHAAVVYTGTPDNTPSIVITYNGIALEEGIDYILISKTPDSSIDDPQPAINVCDNASILIQGIGSIKDTYEIPNAFSIIPAANNWDTVPSIMYWLYGSYSKDVNLIYGSPVLLDNANDLYFSIYSADGSVVEGLEVIRLDSEGKVNEEQEAILSGLNVGMYSMRATVIGNDNYSELSAEISFQVFKGVNTWDAGEAPTIQTWIKGKYNPDVNIINAKAKFGETQIVVRNVQTNQVVYATDIHGNVITNELASAKVGKYLLTATVARTNNYDALTQTIEFEVFRNGLPTWAVVLIVVGALGIVALIFGILHQKGVLQMLTGKVIIAMRTRANVDATIAAVRANRVAREAEASIAAAKAREAEEEKAKQAQAKQDNK